METMWEDVIGSRERAGEYLGHTDPRVTARYYHASEERMAQDAALVNAHLVKTALSRKPFRAVRSDKGSNPSPPLLE